jgi:hypothetical protein
LTLHSCPDAGSHFLNWRPPPGRRTAVRYGNAEAEAEDRDVVGARLRMLGADDPSTLMTKSLL